MFAYVRAHSSLMEYDPDDIMNEFRGFDRDNKWTKMLIWVDGRMNRRIIDLNDFSTKFHHLFDLFYSLKHYSSRKELEDDIKETENSGDKERVKRLKRTLVLGDGIIERYDEYLKKMNLR